MTGERRRTPRRKEDRPNVWSAVGRFLGLIASMTGAALGQAELVGEPYRHWITLVCIVSLAGFGFLLGPQHLKTLTGAVRLGRRRS